MGYLISDADLARVEATQRTLLDLGQAESMADWLNAASTAVRRLMQADAVHTFAAAEGPPVQAGSGVDPAFFNGIEDYFTHAATGDFAAQAAIAVHVQMQQARVVGGAGVYHERTLADRPTIEASPFYQDVCAPNRIRYTTGISVPWKSGEAAICVSFTSADADGYDPAAGALLRLLVPAFEAGLGHWAHRTHGTDRLRRTIDVLAEPAVLFRADGKEQHRNRALRRFLSGDPHADRILRTAAAMAEDVRPAPSDATVPRVAVPTRQVDAAGGTYRLRACVVRPEVAGPPAVLVTVERLSFFPPPPALVRRFGLTPREAEVAVQVAHGASNTDLAERLHISSHTARHHVASVLKKLGVSSRAKVAVRLLGG